MNNKIKGILPQLLTILFVVLVFGFFTINAQVNMDNRGIDFGFGFLSQEASCDKKPNPKSIPLLSILTCALIVKKPKTKTTNRMVKSWGRIPLILLFIWPYNKKKG